MKNPWKKIDSQVVFSNEWLTLRTDTVIRPDGRQGLYTVVDTRVATGVVALTPSREVYLVGQYRYPTDVYSWEIVEGGTDAGEGPLGAAKRELREEAGLIAETWSPLGGPVHLSNCITSETGFLFLAENLREVGASPDATEVLEVKTMPLAEALGLVERGEIYDAMTIMGLMLAVRRLGG